MGSDNEAVLLWLTSAVIAMENVALHTMDGGNSCNIAMGAAVACQHDIDHFQTYNDRGRARAFCL